MLYARISSSSALVVLGIACFLLQPVVDPEPEPRCVPDGQPSSGWLDEDRDCNVSQASYGEIRAYETGAKPLRIVGALFIVAAIAVAVLGFLRRRGRSDDGDPAAPHGS